MIPFIDRLGAAAIGMAGALYFMSAVISWFRVLRPVEREQSISDKVILDRAIAWTALCAIFSSVTMVKLGLASWYDIDIILIFGSLAVFLAGLISVRAITMAGFGNKVLIVFVAVSLAVGASILFFF